MRSTRMPLADMYHSRNKNSCEKKFLTKNEPSRVEIRAGKFQADRLIHWVVMGIQQHATWREGTLCDHVRIWQTAIWEGLK